MFWGVLIQSATTLAAARYTFDMTRLDRHVSAVRQRMTLQTFLRRAALAVLVAGAAAWLYVLVARLAAVRLAGEWVWFLGVLGAALVVAAVWAIVRRPGESEAARAIDGKLGLKDKFGTALAFRGSPDPFAAAAVADAERTADDVDLAGQFRPKMPDLTWAALAVAFGALLTGWLMNDVGLFGGGDDPTTAVTVEQREKQDAARRDVEQALAAINAAPEVVQAQDEIVQARAELTELTRTPPADPARASRTAAKAAAGLEEAIAEQIKDNAKYAQAKQDEALLRNLPPLADQEGEIADAADKLREGNLDGAMDDLQQAVDDFADQSPEEQEKTAQQVQQLAKQLQQAATDPAQQQQMQQQLQQMGMNQQQAQQAVQAMQQAAQGDPQAAQQLQQMAAQAMQQMNNGQGATQQQQQQVQQMIQQMQAQANSQATGQQMAQAAQQMAQAMQQQAAQGAGGQQQAGGQQPGQQPGQQGQQQAMQQGANQMQQTLQQMQAVQQDMQQVQAAQQQAQQAAQQAQRNAQGQQQAQQGGQQQGQGQQGQGQQQGQANTQGGQQPGQGQPGGQAAQGQAGAGQGQAGGQQGGNQPGGAGQGQANGGWQPGNPNQPGNGMGGAGQGRGGQAPFAAAPFGVKPELSPSENQDDGKLLASYFIKSDAVVGESTAELRDVAQSAVQNAPDEVDQQRISRQAQSAVKEYFNALGDPAEPAE